MSRKYSEKSKKNKKSKKTIHGGSRRYRRNTSKHINKSRKNTNKSHRRNIQRGGVYYTFDGTDQIGGLARVIAGSNCPTSRPDSESYKFELYGKTAQ